MQQFARSRALLSILSLTILLILPATAQEFPIVGDWANRDPSSPWSGKVPTEQEWEKIDSLQFNWLKVNLNADDALTEAILDQPYRFIVDRTRPQGPRYYQNCDIQYLSDTRRRRCTRCFLARYVMGAFNVRLHPEHEFDYMIVNTDHGERWSDGNATKTPFMKLPDAPDCIRSITAIHSQGIVAEFPTANTNSNDALLKVRWGDIRHVRIRARLGAAPGGNVPVYRLHFRSRPDEHSAWVDHHFLDFSGNDFQSPATEWQTIYKAFNPPSSPPEQLLQKDIQIEWMGNVDAWLDWVEISNERAQ
jgi:hypothetical protein